MTKFWRRVAWVGGGVLVLSLVAFHYRAEGRTPEVRSPTVAADHGPVVAKVTASGTLSALVTVQVGSQVSGRIQTLNADFNSKVHQGEVLAKIDPRLFEAEVEKARANDVAAQGNLARARAQAADADRQFQRSKDLLAKTLVSQADFDTARATADAARAAVEAARGSVEQARAALDLGLRMAVGARPRVILAQFLAEALTLSVAGGLAGIGVGLFAADRLAAQFGWPMLTDPATIALAVGFSGVVGIAFGLYPAHRASRLDPIEALRYE